MNAGYLAQLAQRRTPPAAKGGRLVTRGVPAQAGDKEPAALVWARVTSPGPTAGARWRIHRSHPAPEHPVVSDQELCSGAAPRPDPM